MIDEDDIVDLITTYMFAQPASCSSERKLDIIMFGGILAGKFDQQELKAVRSDRKHKTPSRESYARRLRKSRKFNEHTARIRKVQQRQYYNKIKKSRIRGLG